MNKQMKGKYEKLMSFIREKGKNGAVVAFSGGVDSSTLAAICIDILKGKVAVVTAKSATYPQQELDEAKKLARRIGIKHYIVETNEVANEDFALNPEDRCYYCKRELLNASKELAHELGYEAVFEGTNFSDLSGHRPGLRAIREGKNVFSPWVEAKFTKQEIRTLAKETRLPVYDKPASPCLASRIPFGQRITEERLRRIELAERRIREITGAKELRVRDHGDLARIELGKNERKLLLDLPTIDKTVEALKKLGFKVITMDLEGYRTGSMLEFINGN